MTREELQERVVQMEDAIESLQDAMNTIRDCVKDTRVQSSAESYCIAQIEVAVSDDHSWMSRGMFTLKDALDGMQEELDEWSEGND